MLALGAGSAQAQVPYSATPSGGSGKAAPQTCDPDYWNSMTAKAWMEAEREIIQNKNLIFKPDSVMEYVCFDSFMQHTAKYVGDIFTHTDYFEGKLIIPRGQQKISLEYTLTDAVTNSLKSYIESNFNHKFLGERAQKRGDMLADRTLGDASNMRQYECIVMANVWQGAKCENLIHNANFTNDGFYPFDDLKDAGGNVKVKSYNTLPDMRKYPIGCGKPDYDVWTWDKAIERSANENDDMYDFAKPNKKTYDEIRPRLEPGNCKKEHAILTGVTVLTDVRGSGGYPDGVCSNPGCTYTEGGSCQ